MPILPRDMCLPGEGLHGPPPCISMHVACNPFGIHQQSVAQHSIQHCLCSGDILACVLSVPRCSNLLSLYPFFSLNHLSTHHKASTSHLDDVSSLSTSLTDHPDAKFNHCLRSITANYRRRFKATLGQRTHSFLFLNQ